MDYVVVFRVRDDNRGYALGCPQQGSAMVLISSLEKEPGYWSYTLYGLGGRVLRSYRTPGADGLDGAFLAEYRWFLGQCELLFREEPPRMRDDVPESEDSYAGSSEWTGEV